MELKSKINRRKTYEKKQSFKTNGSCSVGRSNRNRWFSGTLTARSEAVTNTFTVGKGLHDTDITLDEAQVNENGEEIDGAERVQKNTYQNLEQGDGSDKDPTVTIKDTAADCYVFVLVDGLKKNTSIYDVDIKKSWMKVEGIPKEIQDQVPDTADLYVYKADQSTPTVVRGGLTAEKELFLTELRLKMTQPYSNL